MTPFLALASLVHDEMHMSPDATRFFIESNEDETLNCIQEQQNTVIGDPVKTRILVVLLSCLLALPAFAGPFGFERGMTKEQVIALVGQGAVLRERGNYLVLKTAPKPHPAFEDYTLAFSPKDGLLKIRASGKEIQSSSDGADVKNEFDALRAGLVEKYGPGSDLQRQRSTGIWSDRQYLLMAIKQKDAMWATVWLFAVPSSQPDRLSAIAEEINATASNRGYVSVSYEFQGWNEFHDQNQAEQNKNL
jgi:hypothetical protein